LASNFLRKNDVSIFDRKREWERLVPGITDIMKQLTNALFAVVCLGCLLLSPLMPGLSVVPLAGAVVAPDMTDSPVDPTL
jgi:hypothetical protein